MFEEEGENESFMAFALPSPLVVIEEVCVEFVDTHTSLWDL
jgi:hypothetical protein